jgi:hypothetical protein
MGAISTRAPVAKGAIAPPPEEELCLCEELKRVGFIRGRQIVLYGLKLELVGDPIVIGPNLVVVDAIEKNSSVIRRVCIPLTILRQARGNRKGA